MEIFVEVLKPIVEITEAIGGEKLVTISTIKLLPHKLLSKHLIEKPTDKTLITILKNILLTDRRNYRSKEYTEQSMTLASRHCLSYLRQREMTSLVW